MRTAKSYTAAALIWLVVVTPAAASSIDDFGTWTQIQDPFHPGMTGSVDNPAQVTLTAVGPVPAGTDIGYQSINGNNAAGSSSGHYFSIAQNFHIAVDFSVSDTNSTGFSAIGFGIGEDSDGMNSAGPVLAILNGSPVAFSGGARVNDITQDPTEPVVPFSGTNGRFFVSYDSLSGDIIYGVNTTPGSSAPSVTGTFDNLQNRWNEENLLASFFLRSDDPFLFPPLQSGTVNAVFSNFEVLSGTAIAAVPLPAAVWLFGAALVGLAIKTRLKPRTIG